MSGLHSKQGVSDGIHGIVGIELADAAARLAYPYAATDVNRVVHQLDDDTLWMVLTAAPTFAAIGTPPSVPPHASTHQNGGSDEISVAGLSGLLADPQAPLGHAPSHQHGGSDEVATAVAAANAIPKANGTGTLAAGWVDDTSHGARGGGTLHADAVPSGASGFFSGTDKAKLDGLPSSAVPTTRAVNTSPPLAGGGDLSADRTLSIATATTASLGVVELANDGEAVGGVVVQGNDSRLSNARTPTAHATSHQHGGSDEVAVAAPAANAIPKAGAGSTLAAGWLPAATESAQGAAEIATQVETDAGTDDARFVTPLKLKTWSGRGSPVIWGNGSVSASTTTRYLSPGFGSGTAPTVRVGIPFDAPGRIDLLRVLHDSAAGNGNSIVYTVRKNGVAQTLTVTLATGAVGQAANASNSFEVVAGDVVDIEITKAASVGTSPTNINAMFRFTPT